MKIRRCSIYQFGKLKNREFEFRDGITLISGKNESGKTTLHTALAALLFGAEKGRGRAAANSIYQANQPWTDPELYGGSLDWERSGSLIHTERDLAKTPPRAYITETKAGNTREVGAADLPWPPSLTPYLYYNTLSFRQMGSGVEGGLADELRSHIINLQCSGDESIDIASALSELKTRRKALQKQIIPEARTQTEETEQRMHLLEQESFADRPDNWSDAHRTLEAQEASARQLAEKRRSVKADIQRRENWLAERQITDPKEVEEDLDRAATMKEQMELFRDSYAGNMPSRTVLRIVSIVTLLLTALFFWLVIQAMQLHHYGQLWISVAVLFAAMFFSTRYSRKQDALDANDHNITALKLLLKKYLPGYEAKGTPEEAAELTGYLTKVNDLFGSLSEQRTAFQEMSDELADALGRQQSLSRRLEQQMDSRVRRGRWEAEMRALMDQQERLEPVLRNNARLNEEIRALDLASDTLIRLAGEVYSDFGAPLTESASAVFREVTGGRYEGVRINNKLEIFAVQNHQLVAPKALSAGTMEQLYFAFRLAVIRLLWPGEAMPLFFDDSFAFYDNERLGALLQWLHTQYQGQVFLFTCQDREETLLQEQQIPYQKIEL